jgi:hypothetical protein
MGRVVGILIGGVAALGLVLTGCSTSETTTESPAAASASDFCKQAEDMQAQYLAAVQKIASEGKTQDEAALKELQDQLVSDVKNLQQSLPGDAPENVQTAFKNVVDNLETGGEPTAENQADDATLSAYMAEQCPELGVAASEEPAPVDPATPAN